MNTCSRSSLPKMRLPWVRKRKTGIRIIGDEDSTATQAAGLPRPLPLRVSHCQRHLLQYADTNFRHTLPSDWLPTLNTANSRCPYRYY